MTPPVISVRGLTVRAGGRRILSDLDFDLPEGALMALMGPMGSGKSTLLQVLAGAGASDLDIGWTSASYRAPASVRPRVPLLIRQPVREAIACSATAAATRIARISAVTRASEAVLCIDEPTAGLAAEDGAAVMAALEARRAVAPVLVVSHNAAEVARHCSHVALCAGGRIVASEPAARFFGPGAPAEVAHFLRTGGLALPAPDTPAAHLAPEFRVTPKGFDTSPARTGGGPVWILPGRLLLATGTVPPPGPGERVLAVHPDCAEMLGEDGSGVRHPWPGADRPPDGGPEPVLAILWALTTELAAGNSVTLAGGGNLSGTAALLGAVLIQGGFAPDAAARIVAAKLPQLCLGLRLEQLFWDLDLALSMTAG